MELPLGGPALRHYTQSRPRPHRQKLNYRPSRPQEPIIESENEVLELMGRVDEGVEEFFTKRVLPAEILKNQDEEPSITVQEVAPASSVSCPPPTKTLRRKLGDFFTLKKRRGLKSETSQEGRPKKASIADLIRPLREVARAEKEKDKDKVKENEKETEKEKGKEDHSTVTGELAVEETLVPGAPALRGEAVPPRRALREGKSQSLILLSGSAAAGTTNARHTGKKHYEGQDSFEQKLHLMLQRIGVSKAQPGETQKQEGEMKKAESEGTIIDSKPEPPPTFTKPRTMSTSSDTRHQIRPSASAHESAGKPALLPKPVIKPGPPVTTSGRNTPENELAQIQEGEAITPSKLSPTAVLSTPASSTLSATPILTGPTTSASIPDPTNFTISSSSTVTPSDKDICTDSVTPSAATPTPMNVTELEGKASVPAASATPTVLPTSTPLTPLTSTTTPTTITTCATTTSTSSESITPNLSVTYSSTTITTPSITTSVPSNENLVSTSTNMSTKSSLPMLNGTIPTDTAPAATTDTTISVPAPVDTTSPVSTSTSNMPPGCSATTSSVTLANDDSTSVTIIATSSITPDPSVAKMISPPPNSNDTVSIPTLTTVVSTDTTIDTIMFDPSLICPVSAALPPTSSTSPTTADVTSPKSTDCIKSFSTPAQTHPATPSPADISIPSTSTSTTGHTGTTSTTTESVTPEPVNCPLTTDPDPTNSNSTILTPYIPTFPAIDNSSATSDDLTSPVPSNYDSPGQDNDLQTSPEGKSSLEPAIKDPAADGEDEMVQNNQQSEMDESRKDDDGRKDTENKEEKSILVNSAVTRKEVLEKNTKADDNTMRKETGLEKAQSNKDFELCGNEGVIEGEKQEGTKSMDEK